MPTETSFLPLFKAFTFKGGKFLAVARDDGVHILAENGDSYGSWMTIESFKKFRNWDKYPGYTWKLMCLGKARLLCQPC